MKNSLKKNAPRRKTISLQKAGEPTGNNHPDHDLSSVDHEAETPPSNEKMESTEPNGHTHEEVETQVDVTTEDQSIPPRPGTTFGKYKKIRRHSVEELEETGWMTKNYDDPTLEEDHHCIRNLKILTFSKC